MISSDRADRRREAALGLAMVAAPIGVVLLLIVVPAIQAATFSLGLVPTDNLVFSTGQHLVNSDTPTLAVYRDLLASPFIRDDLWLTVWISLLSVVLVAIVAYVLALYVRFGSGRLPKIVRSLYLIPMFVPVVIASYAAITFYVDRGVLAAILHAFGLAYVSPAYKASGVVITQVWFNIPFAVLMLGSGLDGIEQELIESAHDVGAGLSDRAVAHRAADERGAAADRAHLHVHRRRRQLHDSVLDRSQRAPDDGRCHPGLLL